MQAPLTKATSRICKALYHNKKEDDTVNQYHPPVVEHIGLEPITSTLPVSRSSQMS